MRSGCPLLGCVMDSAQRDGGKDSRGTIRCQVCRSFKINIKSVIVFQSFQPPTLFPVRDWYILPDNSISDASFDICSPCLKSPMALSWFDFNCPLCTFLSFVCKKEMTAKSFSDVFHDCWQEPCRGQCASCSGRCAAKSMRSQKRPGFLCAHPVSTLLEACTFLCLS